MQTQNLSPLFLIHLLSALFLGVVGCGRKEAAEMAVGTWYDKTDSYSMEISDGHTFVINEIPRSGGARVAPPIYQGHLVDGTWTIEGDELKFTVTLRNGMDNSAAKKLRTENPKKARAELGAFDWPTSGAFTDGGRTLTLEPKELVLTKDMPTSHSDPAAP